VFRFFYAWMNMGLSIDRVTLLLTFGSTNAYGLFMETKLLQVDLQRTSIWVQKKQV
jgi:hypothetical protein